MVMSQSKLNKHKTGTAYPYGPGFIYLVSCGEFHKLGATVNPEQRWKDLNRTTPWSCRQIHIFEVSEMRFAESYLHKLLKPYCVRREWYVLPSDIVAWICSIEKLERGNDLISPKIEENFFVKAEAIRESQDLNKLKAFIQENFSTQILPSENGQTLKTAIRLLEKLLQLEEQFQTKFGTTDPQIIRRRAGCHPDKPHHAKGLCFGCYQKIWMRAQPPAPIEQNSAAE